MRDHALPRIHERVRSRVLRRAGRYRWLAVSDALPAGDPDVLAAEWLNLRSLVARGEELDDSERADLNHRIEVHAAPYETYFYDWLQRDGIDWMFGINMTLSDAVPVTL